MTTVRTQTAVTDGETTYAVDFDGTKTVTRTVAHALYAEIKRLRAKVASSHDQIEALRGVVEMTVAEFERIGHTPTLIMSAASAALLSSENKEAS